MFGLAPLKPWPELDVKADFGGREHFRRPQRHRLVTEAATLPLPLPLPSHPHSIPSPHLSNIRVMPASRCWFGAIVLAIEVRLWLGSTDSTAMASSPFLPSPSLLIAV